MAISTDHKLTFIVETGYQGKKIGLNWKLEQAVPAPYRGRQEDAVYNQVQDHLDDLSRRTGFDYLILYWGDDKGAIDYVQHQQLELF